MTVAIGARTAESLGKVAAAARLGLRALLLASTLLLPAPLSAQVSAQAPATLMADQVFVDPAGRLVASGAVEVWHGSVRLTAVRVVYDRARDRLEVEGPLTISDGPDQVILADAAQLSPGLQAGLMTGARIVLDQQLQIAAARIERGSDGTNRMDAVVASSCPVCASNPTPLWEIRAARVLQDETTGRLQFQRAQLRLAGVPVFYAPRLNLPAPGTSRMRGFLRPELALDSDLGLSVGMPYFIPLGPTQDLTLTPRLASGGAVSLGLRWRRAWHSGGIEVGGQISHDDLTAEDLRGYGYIRALFRLRDDWVLSADVLVASDRTYLETYNITNDARLSGHVTLERVRRDQAVRARLLAFYSLRAADVNAELPNRAAQAGLQQHHALFGGDLAVTLDARAFWRRSAADAVGRDVARAGLELAWRRGGVLPGGVLAQVALAGRVDHVAVGDDLLYPDPVTRHALQGMLELRWPWAAAGTGGNRTVITPVVQVIGARHGGGALPNDDHTMPELDGGSLFALSRHSGRDAPDDGSRINAGLHWARLAADGWTTEALLGRVWRADPLPGFAPGHVQPLGVSRSDWLVAGRMIHPDGHALSLRALVGPGDSLSRAEANLALVAGRTQVASRYLYVPANLAEDRAVDLAEWSLDLTRRHQNGWSTTIGWDYDFGQNLFAAARTGLTFANECLSFDLTLARRFVTATNPSASTRFDMRIELLGIGGRAPSTPGRTCRA